MDNVDEDVHIKLKFFEKMGVIHKLTDQFSQGCGSKIIKNLIKMKDLLDLGAVYEYNWSDVF